MKSKLCKLTAALFLMITAAVPLRAAEYWEPSTILGSTFERGNGTLFNPYVIHTAQQLANYERGRSKATIEKAAAICKALEVTYTIGA